MSATWQSAANLLYGKIDPIINDSLTTSRRILGTNSSGSFRYWSESDPNSGGGTSSKAFASSGDLARCNELGIRFVQGGAVFLGCANKWYYSNAWNYMLCYLNTSNGGITWHKFGHNYWSSSSHKYDNQEWALTAGVIPVFDLVANAMIVGGQGTFESPYRIDSSN